MKKGREKVTCYFIQLILKIYFFAHYRIAGNAHNRVRRTDRGLNSPDAYARNSLFYLMGRLKEVSIHKAESSYDKLI